MSCEAASSNTPADSTGAQPDGETGAKRERSYKNILASSALIGGSSALNIFIGILRTKALALMLGPAGYGIMGAYGLITELTRSIAQLGVNSSGVRQIADAVATGDQKRIEQTVSVLRWISIFCAFLGGISLVILSESIAQFSFENTQHSHDIAWLSIAVFCMIIAGGQGALLQGMRRIAEIARVSVLGGLMGTAIAVVMVYCYGEKGIAPSMIIVAACSMAVSWWYSRKLNIRAHAVSPENLIAESSVLFKLGLAFLGSALLMQGAAYAVRIIILRNAGLESAGVYQAAWTLGGLYIGFILNAMGTDFYPRLVGVAQNNAECNRMVNEQAHVSLLLALPGVLATIVFAPLVISLFYSSKFSASVEVLRWICLGMGIRVLIYPLGYIVVAKNLRVLFIAMDATWVVVNLVLTYWWVQVLGAVGAGMAYTAAYVLHGVIVCLLVRRVSGFRWDIPVRQTAFLFVAMSIGVFLTSTKLPTLAAVLVGLLAVTAATAYSARSLLILVEPQHLPAKLRRLFSLISRLRYGKRTVQ